MEDNKEDKTTNNIEDLPQWAQDELAKVRSEAAKHRVAKKEAVEKAKEETTAEYNKRIEDLEAKLEAANEQINTERLEAAKIEAALEAGIEADKIHAFANLLKGEDKDELVSHAKEVKKLFLTEEKPSEETHSDPATDPSQGQGNHLPLNGDPILNQVLAKINH